MHHKVGDAVDGATLQNSVIEAMQKAGSGTMQMSAGKVKVRSEFVFTHATLEQHLSVPTPNGTLEIISLGKVIYIKGLPGSTKPWVKADPKGSDPLSKGMAALSNKGLNDPHVMANAMKGTRAKVTAVSGERTTYAIDVDMAKVLGAGSRSAAPSAPVVTMRYTIDGSNRPVSVKSSVQGQEIEVTYSGWGARVSVKAPPADQVGTYRMPALPKVSA